MQRASRLRALGVNLLVMVVSLAVFFGLAEAGARLAGYSPYQAQSEAFRQAFESSDRNGVGMFAPDPARIWDLNPGYTGHRTDWGDRNWVTLTINLQGRRDAEVTLAKPPNTVRIALLGDSVAFGARVKVEDDFASLMQNALNARADGRRYEVLNFGVSGYSTWQELSTLKQKALAYKPDLVLLAFVMNDLYDNNQAAGQGYLTMTRVQGIAKWLRENSGFYRFVREQVLSVESRVVLQNPCAQADPWACWDNTRTLLDDMDTTARAGGAKFAIVAFPVNQQVGTPDPAFAARYQGVMADYAREHQVAEIDLLPAFLAEKATGGELFVDDYHPNERGHALTARVILEQVDALGLLPPP